MKRFVIKTEKEKKRGEKGSLTMFYGYDNKRKKIITPMSPFKKDIEKLIYSYEISVLFMEISHV